MPPLPWYRQVSAAQWKAFLTTFAAWVLDAFDFTILTFVLADIQQSFSVNKALAGLLGTVTLLFRVVGGIGAGTLADRYGRKGPILFSIAWYTAFAFLSGASTSYVMLFAFRGLFGIGMGGMWAAGMPLALEHWPQHLRGIASGILQGGYSFGFLLSSLVFQLGYPLVSDRPEWAWRVMLWSGVLPAMVVFAVMWTVPESPIWLERQRAAGRRGRRRATLGRAALRSRPALGHAAHVAADGRLRGDVPVHDVLVSDAAVVASADAARLPAGPQRRRRDRIGGPRRAVGEGRSAGADRRRSASSSGWPRSPGILDAASSTALLAAAACHGLLRRRRLGHGPGLPVGALPHRGARRRHRLRLPRRRRHRILRAVSSSAASRTAAWTLREAMAVCLVTAGVLVWCCSGWVRRRAAAPSTCNRALSRRQLARWRRNCHLGGFGVPCRCLRDRAGDI